MSQANETRQVEILDLASDLFREDSDTDEALDDFLRGFKSANELKERLEFLKMVALQRAERRVCGPVDIHELREEREIEIGEVIRDAREGA